MNPPGKPSLAQRSIRSVTWNMIANVGRIGILIARSVFLARLLPVETFGIYGYASSIASLTLVIASFGLGDAFIHRAIETENEEEAAATYFTLRIIFILIWAICVVIGAFLFLDGDTRITLLYLVVLLGGLHLADTPKYILMRRVFHRRLAVIQLLTAAISTILALTLAVRGATIGALLVTDLVAFLINVIMLFVWRPVWRPRLFWSRHIVKYYVRFGVPNLTANLLERVLDQGDDIWTGFFLGKTELGYYSRAYTFATYPRVLLATPINTVIGGTYAELIGDRRRLSQAFYQANALLIRGSFYLGGVMALVAPEFILIVLGEKWLPMLAAFRLMLLFTLVDPLRRTLSSLFVAQGQPGLVAQVRIVQVVIMVICLFVLGSNQGIVGVALSVNIMTIVGFLFLLLMARSIVDFRPLQMLGLPTIALILGIILSLGSLQIQDSTSTALGSGMIKATVFTLCYVSVLLVFERRSITKMVNYVIKQFLNNKELGSKVEIPE